MDEKRHTGKGAPYAAMSAASLGLTMVLCTVIGLGLGLFIDRYAGTKPWCTIVFFCIGVAAGFHQILKEAGMYASGHRR
jgi:F0F1-type ATP synthase assembly protein I